MSISSDSDSDWGESPPAKRAKRSKLASKVVSKVKSTPRTSTQISRQPSGSSAQRRARPSQRQSEAQSDPHSDEDFQTANRPAQGPRLSREEKQFQKQLALALAASTLAASTLESPPERLIASPTPSTPSATPPLPEEDSTAPLSCSLSPLAPEPSLPKPVRPLSTEKAINPLPNLQGISPRLSPVHSGSSGSSCPGTVTKLKGPLAPPSGSSPGGTPVVVPPSASAQVASALPARPSPPVVQWKPPRGRTVQGGPNAASPNHASPGGRSTFRPRVGLSRNIRGIKPLHAKVAWHPS